MLRAEKAGILLFGVQNVLIEVVLDSMFDWQTLAFADDVWVS